MVHFGVGVAAAVLGLLALALIVFWRAWFLRRPERAVPRDGIVSPADGTIMRIIAFRGGVARVPKGVLGVVRTLTSDVAPQGNIIVIMLTALNVHYQRAPISGSVVYTRHTRGKFSNAVLGRGRAGAFENEKNEVLFSSGKMRAKVVQVAGFAARRITCMVRQNEHATKGQVIGLINFGSQVLLILPERELLVREGQRVVDGETVIAR